MASLRTYRFILSDSEVEILCWALTAFRTICHPDEKPKAEALRSFLEHERHIQRAAEVAS